MIGVISLILGFQSSTNLAAAYSLAVSGTMASHTVLLSGVMYVIWKWNTFLIGVLAVVFLAADLAFFTASTSRILDGGWVPLLIGTAVFTLLTTWKKGRDLVVQHLREKSIPIEKFLASITDQMPARAPGTAVYMTSNRQGVPLALLHNLKHNKILHETVVLLTVVTENVPRIAPDKRREIRQLGDDFFRIVLRYGFMETPNLPRVLKSTTRDLDFVLTHTTFFLSRETLIPAITPRMAPWRLKLFVSMARNTASAVNFFHIPLDRVVELGVQVPL